MFQRWRSEVDEKREVFHALEDELQRAKTISDEMFKTYKERDLDLDWHKEKADQLVERWQNVHIQIDNRSVPFPFGFSSDLIFLLSILGSLGVLGIYLPYVINSVELISI